MIVSPFKYVSLQFSKQVFVVHILTVRYFNVSEIKVSACSEKRAKILVVYLCINHTCHVDTNTKAYMMIRLTIVTVGCRVSFI